MEPITIQDDDLRVQKYRGIVEPITIQEDGDVYVQATPGSYSSLVLGDYDPTVQAYGIVSPITIQDNDLYVQKRKNV